MRNDGSVGLRIFVGVMAVLVLTLVVIAVLAVCKLFNRGTEPIESFGVALERPVSVDDNSTGIDVATAIKPLATVDGGESLRNDESNPAGYIEPPVPATSLKDPMNKIGAPAPIIID